MPVNEVTPSLGELANAGQSEAAIPDTAVTNNNELVQTLNQNARFKAQNDYNKFINFQSNLKDAYANTAAVEQMEVLPEDKPEIQADAAKLYSFIAKNPDAFSGRNQQLAGEMQALYGNLSAKATLSKQDNLFDKANRGYVLHNNELNTDENKQIIDDFTKQPLGSRKAYNLSLQPIFDANTYAETLKGQVEKQYSPTQETTQVGFDPATGKVIPGQGYLQTTTTSKIPFKDYINKWNASLEMQTDKNNQPIKGWAKKQYDTLPEEIKKQVPLEKFWEKIGTQLYGSTQNDKGEIQDIIKQTKDEIKADPNYLKQQTIEQQNKALDETRRHNKAMESLGWEKVNSDDKEDDDEAKGTVTQINSVIKDAIRPENLKFVVDTNGNRQQMGTIGDPNLLKAFTNIDKDGKTTNPPDDALIDRTTGQISLVYYKRDPETHEIIKTPDTKTADGKYKNPGAAKIEKSVPVNINTWVSAVVGKNEGAKNKGKVINAVQDFYKKNGGVYQTAQKLNKEEGNQQQAQAVPQKGIGDYTPDIQAGIKAFMKANPSIKSEAEAIKILRDNKKID